MIRPVTTNDALEICNIYNHYVTLSIITFEESPVDVAEMTIRITEITSDLPWLVFVMNGKVVGFTYASRWKSRCAYRYSVESTIYIDQSYTGQGIGEQLYLELITLLRELKLHSVIGGIALPNEPSIKLHEKLGFKKVAHFKEVGWKFSKWIDVGYWQCNLNSVAEHTLTKATY